MAFDAEAVRAFEHERWERAAAVYETTFASATAPFIAPLLDAAKVGSGVRLLDIACGPGAVAAAAAVRGARPCGTDFSAAMLWLARSRHPGIPFHAGDAEALQYDDATFDAAVSNFGIHHVPRPVLALREAYRVLRPGGRVAFSFWADPTENIAWKLVFDAVARHGNHSAAQTPAPGGGFNTTEQCAAALRDVGFVACTTGLARASWHHRDAASLVAALRAGTARMAAMLEAQPAEAIAAIIADIAQHTARYRDAQGIAVPIAAMIASGIRP